MTKETMTIHKALSELKLLDSRIDTTIDTSCYCTHRKNNTTQIAGINLDDYVALIKGSWDKTTDLIKRRTAIKKAVVLSNAKTMVTINSQDYTVAEAIEMKNHGIEFQQELLNTLKTQYLRSQATIKKENEALDKKADDFVTGMLGNKESKTNTEEFNKARKTYIDANTVVMVDPIDVKAKIDALEDEIDKFISEVDSALSVSNALTVIEIEY